MDSTAPLHFAHYEVRRREDGAPWELGRGAMGVTYKAYDPQLRVEVALKVINPAQVGDTKTQALFLREARAAARVNHSNVGRVVYLNQDPANLFYAMEFIEGESLRDWLHPRAPLEPAMAIGVALQIARGLEAIHREGVIHRDLKPTNLMMLRLDPKRKETEPEAWQVKIIDFGLARRLSADVAESALEAATTGFRGTALYASPEQCEERRDLDGRSDLYSLGCVMWEMLVGTPPFRANVHRELLNAHVAKPPPLAQLSHLPAGLQAVVTRLLAKDRDGRFADAGALIKALEKCREQVERGAGGASMQSADAREGPTMHLPSVADSDCAKPITVSAAPRRRRLVPAALLVALTAVGLAVGQWNGWFRSAAGEPIVAVLPFDAGGGSKEDEQLADGLTTELINRLSQIPTMRVISRGAVTGYKNGPGLPRKRIHEIGRELGAIRAVLEGTLRRVGDKLKIDAVLFDARTEKRLWGATYDREWKEMFAIQAEVAEQIARALKSRISTAERQRLQRPTTENMTAYDLYLRAIQRGEDDPEAKSLLQRAVDLDPRFAEAYARLAIYHFRAFVRPALTVGYSLDLIADFEAAESNARKAVEIDPECTDGLLVLSAVFQRQGKVAEAQELVRSALKLAPSDTTANLRAASTAHIEGRYDEFYYYARRARVLAPSDPNVARRLLDIVVELGLLDLVDFWTRWTLELTPEPKEREVLEINRLMIHGDYAAVQERIRIHPELRVLDAILLDCQIWQSDWTAVLATSERQMRREPKIQEAMIDRAYALWALGRSDEAREAATQSLEEDKKYLEATKEKRLRDRGIYRRMALALQILGREADAVEQLEQWEKSNQPAAGFFLVEVWWQSVFKSNAAAQVILNRMGQKYKLMAKRVLEIEKAYADNVLGGKM